jgi:hypothetical protein
MNRIVISPCSFISDLGFAPPPIYTSNNDRQIRHGRALVHFQENLLAANGA